MGSSFQRRARPVGVLALASAVGVLVALSAFGGSASASRHRASAHSAAFSVVTQPFGTVGGKPVNLYTLSNGSMDVKITNFGGIVQSIDVPDRSGQLANVALGFKDLAGYLANDGISQPVPSGGSGTTYFGAIIGRYANRIAKGMFTLNGKTYHLPINNGVNTLHGGTNAWNTKVWTPSTSSGPGGVSLQLTYTSPALEDGFPGTVVATVTYTLNADNALEIHYRATTTDPTVINLTNHTYFNLAGESSGDVYNQRLMINANGFTPTDSGLIPLGTISQVAGTPFDFRTMKPIGQNIRDANDQLLTAHGYDQNWVLNRGSNTGLTLAARAVDPVSGRTLTTSTTEPGVQLYTSNFLVGDLVGSGGKIYRQGAGFTLETQHFPNSPNQPNFPSTVLNPGTPFNSATVFKFGVDK
jgi:aldose 1-epimerase